MLQSLLTKTFWHGAWIWCKANWKFVLGVSIPVILTIIWRKGNAAIIMRHGIRARDEMIVAEREAAGLEIKLKDKASDNFVDSMKDLEDKYRTDLDRIEADRIAAEGRDLTADDASRELSNKYHLRLVEDEDDE
jgi:hypothetical protein